jgi:hypothetical protein
MNWTRSGTQQEGKVGGCALGGRQWPKRSRPEARTRLRWLSAGKTTHMHDARGLLGRKQKVRCSRKLPRERKRAPLTLIYPSNPAALHTVVLLCRFRFLRSSGASKDFRHPSASKEECVLHCIFSCEILSSYGYISFLFEQ